MIKLILNVLKQLLTGFFGWVFVAPLVSFLPRRKNLLVVIGRNGGKFVDNTKYFYLQSKSIISEQVECVWLTTSREEYNALSSKGLLVCFYPSVAGISLLLRAGILVVDSFDWYLSMRRFLLCGAKKVQLWHGAGIKRIENDAVFNQWESKVGFFSFFISRLQIFLRTFTGRSVRYDLVVSTSDFFQREFFIPSFFSRNFKVIGYPRNVFATDEYSLLNTDYSIYKKVSMWKRSDRRIVLIVPTFRDSRPTPMGLDSASCRSLDMWCEINKVELVFKFHPWERGSVAVTGNHLHIYAANSDLYPLMGLVDAMITDYSSIYLDFLLLDKPVLFLVPDLEKYLQLDRQMVFDYDEVSPGPKVKTWPELLEALEQQWEEDGYHLQRQDLSLKAFDGLPQEEATQKILDFMQEKGWLISFSS